MLLKKKYYEEPTIEVIVFSEADVLGLSDGEDTGTLVPGDDDDPWDLDEFD